MYKYLAQVDLKNKSIDEITVELGELNIFIEKYYRNISIVKLSCSDELSSVFHENITGLELIEKKYSISEEE